MFHLGDFVTIEVIERIAVDMADVYAADLINEEPGYLSVDLDYGSEDGGLRRCGRGDDRCDSPRHGTGTEYQTEAFSSLLVTALGLSQVHTVDRAPDHQASASSVRSSSARRSASERA